ncbi:MAG: alpha/beta hydrolase [Bacteroidota bacterium]
MPSKRSYVIRWGIWLRRKLVPAHKMTIQQIREAFDALLKKVKIPEGVDITRVALNGILCEKTTPENPENGVVLFVHGGGFCIGSLEGYRSLAGYIALEVNRTTISVDYKLAPEFPFPAGLNDVVSVYEALLKDHKPSEIALFGDSAGGGLVLSTLLKLKEDKLPVPSCAVLVCPWVDLTFSGKSYLEARRKDPMLSKAGLEDFARKYLNGTPETNHYASPLFGDLSDLCPLMIQAGEHDVLRSDSETLAEKALKAGVEVNMKVWKGMFHVWQFYVRILPEARQSLVEIGVYVKNKMKP